MLCKKLKVIEDSHLAVSSRQRTRGRFVARYCRRCQLLSAGLVTEGLATRKSKNMGRGNGPDPCNLELHKEPGTRGGAADVTVIVLSRHLAANILSTYGVEFNITIGLDIEIRPSFATPAIDNQSNHFMVEAY